MCLNNDKKFAVTSFISERKSEKDMFSCYFLYIFYVEQKKQTNKQTKKKKSQIIRKKTRHQRFSKSYSLAASKLLTTQSNNKN